MRTAVAVAAVLLSVAATSGPAVAGVDVDPSELSPHLFIHGEDEQPGSSDTTPIGAGTPTAQPAPPTDDRNTHCELDAVGVPQCYFVGDPEDPAEPDDEREVKPGDVLRATREIGLPSLEVKIQPGDKTLVNIDTIFYAQPEPFARTVQLLGFEVDLEAEPVSYQWVHGDGTTAITATPGEPYPNKDVTHRYLAPADDVQARVDVTYRVRFRVDGGAWQTIDQTLLASGPAAELDVKEAAPVMTTPRV